MLKEDFIHSCSVHSGARPAYTFSFFFGRGWWSGGGGGGGGGVLQGEERGGGGLFFTFEILPQFFRFFCAIASIGKVLQQWSLRSVARPFCGGWESMRCDLSTGGLPVSTTSRMLHELLTFLVENTWWLVTDFAYNNTETYSSRSVLAASHCEIHLWFYY